LRSTSEQRHGRHAAAAALSASAAAADICRRSC
jgi:hypothetical protein